MMTLRPDAGPALVRKHLRFLRRRLTGRPEAEPLRNDITEALTALQLAIDADEDAADEAACATAELEVRDALLDAAVAALVREVLYRVGNDRGDPRFVAAFPSAPSGAMAEMASDAQSIYVRAALTALRQARGLPDLSAPIAEVEAALATLEASKLSRQTAQTASSVSAAALQVAVRAAHDTHNGALARLGVLYPRQKALIRSLFLP